MTSTGIFMRDYVGQTPNTAGTGWSQSPDIMPYGPVAATDPTIFTQSQNYNTDYSGQIGIPEWNYIYLRGINTASQAQTANIYLYYTESALILWPANWRGGPNPMSGQPDPNLLWGGNAQNFVPVSATAAGQIVASTPPLQWYAPPFTQTSPGNHYCLISWVDNGGNPPPDFSQDTNWSLQDLTNFVVQHPNVTTHNTNDVVSSGATRTVGTLIQTQGQALTVYINVYFTKIPTDGTFTLSVPGTTQSNTIALPQQSVPANDQGYSWYINYPANFSTLLTLQYWQGATSLPSGANITAVALSPQSPTMVQSLQEAYPDVNLPLVHLPLYSSAGVVAGIQPAIVIGQQRWNMA